MPPGGKPLLTFGRTVFLALFTVSCLCTLIFQCVPPEVAFMLPRPADAKCFDNSTFTKIGTFNGCECNLPREADIARKPVADGITPYHASD